MTQSTEIPLTENWYIEPFTKRTSCEIPGQCGGECDCGCPYNTMTELDRLPLIEELAAMFPNEWLAFVVSATEEDDLAPTHGKLVAHSPNPDDIFDAQNTVLWNQCVYVYFNGDYEAMARSYGEALDHDDSTVETTVMPKETVRTPPKTEPVPEKLIDLIYSALDQLYIYEQDKPTKLDEAIRRLRIAKMRINFNPDNRLGAVLDGVLDRLEVTQPTVSEAIWELEEALADMDVVAI
jgi:hypothetical protein